MTKNKDKNNVNYSFDRNIISNVNVFDEDNDDYFDDDKNDGHDGAKSIDHDYKDHELFIEKMRIEKVLKMTVMLNWMKITMTLTKLIMKTKQR